MALVEYGRKDARSPEMEPHVTVRGDVFAFNVPFVRAADLGKHTHVMILVDKEEHRIGFRFLKDYESGALTLSSDGKRGSVNRSVEARRLFKDHPWVAAVARFKTPKDRKFSPKFDKSVSAWTISLRPSFEQRVRRTAAGRVSRNIKGIYRYLREGGEVVYIGMGDIIKRLGENERGNWSFDWIEYSIVASELKREELEHYWIERFQQENNGERPLYNRIGGKRPK